MPQHSTAQHTYTQHKNLHRQHNNTLLRQLEDQRIQHERDRKNLVDEVDRLRTQQHIFSARTVPDQRFTNTTSIGLPYTSVQTNPNDTSYTQLHNKPLTQPPTAQTNITTNNSAFHNNLQPSSSLLTYPYNLQLHNSYTNPITTSGPHTQYSNNKLELGELVDTF